MRAFVIRAPGLFDVEEVPDPAPGDGDVLVEVTRVGLCGTDRELADGRLSSRSGTDVITFPRIPGHEWVGIVRQAGARVDAALVGRRVTGNTFIGCGACRSCEIGSVATCPQRQEIGVRGRDGALAELLVVPAANALPVSDTVSDAAAALVEPLSNAVRALAELPRRTRSILIRGAGALGILAFRCATLEGIDVAVIDPDRSARARARAVDVPARDAVSDGRVFDAVLDMAPVSETDTALRAVRDGGVLVMTGFPSPAAMLPARELVERDLRVIGALGAPHQLARSLALVETHPSMVEGLTADPIELTEVPSALRAGPRASGSVKVQVDPRPASRRVPVRPKGTL